jgi:hypothetical protein
VDWFEKIIWGFILFILIIAVTGFSYLFITTGTTEYKYEYIGIIKEIKSQEIQKSTCSHKVIVNGFIYKFDCDETMIKGKGLYKKYIRSKFHPKWKLYDYVVN